MGVQAIDGLVEVHLLDHEPDIHLDRSLTDHSNMYPRLGECTQHLRRDAAGMCDPLADNTNQRMVGLDRHITQLAKLVTEHW